VRHRARLELGDARLERGGMLLMNGSDHLLPQSWLGRVVDDANEEQDDYRFTVTSLPEYLAALALILQLLTLPLLWIGQRAIGRDFMLRRTAT